jgi:3-oxoacyl-[acyl-carrier-protein] synthase III/ribosome-associated toxin RatA of RatAB toxin-antitoxin module
LVEVVETRTLSGHTVEHVWAALKNFERYADFMKDVISVEVDRIDSSQWLSVWNVHLNGVQFSWVEKDILEAPHRLAFELVEGDVEMLAGEWLIKQRPDGVEVTLSMEFDLGIPSMSQTLDPLARRALKSNVDGLLEGLDSMVSGAEPSAKGRISSPVRKPRLAHDPIFVSGHAAITGHPVEISQFKELAGDLELIATLKERGLEYVACFKDQDEAFSTLLECIEQVLDKTQTEAADIDAIFFTNGCSTWKSDDDKRLMRSLAKLNLDHCSLIGANMASCGNTGIAFRVAQGVMASEQLSHALLLTIDWVEPGQSRLSAPDIGMNADGVSACLLTREGGEFSIVDCLNYSDADLADPTLAETDPTKFLDLHIQGISKLLKNTLDVHGLTGKDIDLVLAPNLNSTLTYLIAVSVGMKRARVIAPNIGKTAHVQTADALLNLQTALDEHTPERGAYWLLISSGPQAWSSVLLKAEQPARVAGRKEETRIIETVTPS